MAAQTQDIFDAIDKGQFEEVEKRLKAGIDVNCLDKNGMTPLSMAAYKGNEDLCKLLLQHGADVNSKKHEHGYTPLMFAALAGKPNLCRLLMDFGAYPAATNNIGKTACEMAAFVSQHECVSVINTHVSLDQISKLLNPKESEEKFPEELAKFIHEMVCAHVIHPVALIFSILDYEDGIKYRKKILYIVDRVFESQLRCKEGNEVMSLKLWFILHMLREMYKYIDEHSEKPPSEALTLYAKTLLFMQPEHQVRPNLDALLRAGIVSFPYRQSLLFQTIVKALAKSKFGERPAAYDYIIQVLFGQRILAVSQFCFTCGGFNATKRCPKCRVPYCSQKCQKYDWGIHKKCCAAIGEWHTPNDDSPTDLDALQAQLESASVTS
ncbi:unnamed protein product, partial [Mesorhabditis spiculigera]